jgi:hypothetical protein
VNLLTERCTEQAEDNEHSNQEASKLRATHGISIGGWPALPYSDEGSALI